MTQDKKPPRQDPVGQTPVSQAPLGQKPVDQTPVDQTPSSQTPVDQKTANRNPTGQPPVDDRPEIMPLADGSGAFDFPWEDAAQGDPNLDVDADADDFEDTFDAEFDAFLTGTAQATARPDPATKAAHLRLGQENFAALQGSHNEARHMSDGPNGLWSKWLWQGVRDMMQRLSTRGGLTLTTAVVAGGLLVLSPQGRDLLLPPTQAPALPAQAPVAPAQATLQGPADTDLAPLSEAQTDAQADTQGGARLAPAAPDAEAEASPATAEMANSTPMAAEQAAPVAETMPDAANATSASVAESMADAMADTAPANAPNIGAAAPVQPAPMPPGIPHAAPPPNTLTRMAPGVVMPTLAPQMTEDYANAPANGVQSVAEAPVSTFSVDVDTASWSILRQSLNFGQLPAPQALRIEEMVNYFPYDYAPPAADAAAPFAVHTALIETPWNPDTRLLRIGLQGMVPAERPALNLVFLIDTSGSMEDPAKLPLLTAALRLMLPELAAQDEVAIVTYAGSAGVALPPTSATDRESIIKALTNLTSGGGTAGAAGLAEAYALAATMRADGEISRVILATDGDFNIGPSDPAELERLITKARDGGSYLSVLGFGRGNLDDRTMQTLAQNGNGNAAYVDTLAEAQKVLVDELAGALFPIADDVKVQVEFNPATVAEYRLIGYETRALERQDFNDDRVDAGEIGAGHAVTALYEITPTGSAAVLTDPLRYGTVTATDTASDELAFLRLRWKEPGADESQLFETPIANEVTTDPEAAFAAAIAGFGEILRGDGRTGTWTLEQARDLAAANLGPDPFGYRREAVALIDLAARLQD